MGGRLMPAVDMAVVRIPYINTYADRHGRVRHYFRKRGSKPVALPGTPGSPEFMAAYEAAMTTPAAPLSRHHGAGSVGSLIAGYFQSPDFANLKPSSQRLYRIVLEHFGSMHGHRMVHDMPRAKVAAYIQAIGADKPAMANLTRAVLRKLLTYGVQVGYRDDNPVTMIKPYKSGTHHTWDDGELAAFEARWSLGTRERLAYALLLHTGQRGGDVVKMRRADISGGMISVVQQKTGAALSIPIYPALADALKAYPTKGLHLIGDEAGRPINHAQLLRLMKRAAKAAGLPAHCLPHGLRKAQMRRLAEHGASAKQIAAISGHKTLHEIERYTAAADQKRLAQSAIAKLPKLPNRVPNRGPRD
jgi:integrase